MSKSTHHISGAADLPEARLFTKKPVTISAIQWTGKNLREVITFTDGPPDTRTTHAGMAWEAYTDLVARDGLKIYTLEGKMLASPGDWIIRGVKGEHYPCKPDIFEATYSPAALAAGQAVAPVEAAPDEGFFLLLPKRPKPEAPANTVGLTWDAYTGAQMLAFGRDCSDAALAAQADSQPAPQGETNVQLDIDSNHSAPGQQRDVARSVALGQPMGNGQDQAAGHLGAQGDKLLTVAERNIRSFLRSAVFKSESDREAALSCVDVLRDVARAQADSVLEDAARWKWAEKHMTYAEFLGGSYVSTDKWPAADAIVEIRAVVDAARKQGDQP